MASGDSKQRRFRSEVLVRGPVTMPDMCRLSDAALQPSTVTSNHHQ